MHDWLASSHHMQHVCFKRATANACYLRIACCGVCRLRYGACACVRRMTAEDQHNRPCKHLRHPMVSGGLHCVDASHDLPDGGSPKGGCTPICQRHHAHRVQGLACVGRDRNVCKRQRPAAHHAPSSAFSSCLSPSSSTFLSSSCGFCGCWPAAEPELHPAPAMVLDFKLERKRQTKQQTAQ